MKVELLNPDGWRRWRWLRLRSLLESPDAFGGKYTIEKMFSESDWRNKFLNLDFVVATHDEIDIAVMSVEVLIGDYGSTCWIGGCWTDPDSRGQGALRALFEFLDLHALEKGWKRQGLGVWTDNEAAIAAYQAIGFRAVGEKQASERQLGRFYLHMVRDSVSQRQ